MRYKLNKNIMSNTESRKAFNTLSVKTFGLSFESWYQHGYWSDSNIPYTLFNESNAIANVSVNRLDVLWNGEEKTYIQLGTVMTDEAYRSKGLSRYLMDEVMFDWKNKCDAMILFANESVLEFYPKFGFNREKQHQFCVNMSGGEASFRKLDISKVEDVILLKRCYEKTNPFSKLQVIHNFNLLMFYCLLDMKECIYYSSQYDAIIIAEQEKDTLNCFDVFCDDGCSLMDILRTVAIPETRRITIGFTPYKCENFKIELQDKNDDTLFVLNDKENIFKHEKLLFPIISHT